MSLHLRAMDAIDAAVPGVLFLVEVGLVQLQGNPDALQGLH